MATEEEYIEEIDLGEEEDEDEDEDFMDMGGMLAQVLATEDGDTVCSALVGIAKGIETQNKILVKILSKLPSQS